jgi:hypothetical protein
VTAVTSVGPKTCQMVLNGPVPSQIASWPKGGGAIAELLVAQPSNTGDAKGWTGVKPISVGQKSFTFSYLGPAMQVCRLPPN